MLFGVFLEGIFILHHHLSSKGHVERAENSCYPSYIFINMEIKCKYK